MKACELLNELIKNANYYPDPTVDKIIIGDPQKEIRNVLTTWICSMSAVKEAIEGGFDAIITHEPTFYMHRNELEYLNSLDDGNVTKVIGLKKKELIEKHNLAVIRIHDTWDIRPEVGMADAWASFLGFGKPTAVHPDGFQSRYEIEPITVRELAEKVASKTAKLGEPMVQVIGDENKIVSKVCFGPGYASTVQDGKDLGCDINIMADDGSLFWMDIQSAVDMDYPIIRVNHGTSEEPGTMRMADYIHKNIAGINAVHMPIKPFFKMVGTR